MSTSDGETLYLVAESFIEAARKVDAYGDDHRCSSVHGHSFIAKVYSEFISCESNFDGTEVDELIKQLDGCVDELNYSYLNQLLPVPTDQNIANWLLDRISIDSSCTVGLQSTRNQGVYTVQSGGYIFWRKYRFEAAHQLPNVEPGHQCGRMHGHGFEVVLHSTFLNSIPFNQNVYDFLDQMWDPIQRTLNYTCLNTIAGLENPTSEMLSSWIWSRLKPEYSSLIGVSVFETTTAGCHFNGSDYHIWKEQRFESAIKLTNTPSDDARSRLHGHSYHLRLHLTAPLNIVQGWTVDYGDVKSLFSPVYNMLDHHLLNDIETLGSQGCISVAKWIKDQSIETLPELYQIDLFEKPGCGVVLNWGNSVFHVP